MKKFLKFLFVFLGIVFLCIVLYIIFSDDETAEQDNTINSSDNFFCHLVLYFSKNKSNFFLFS